MNKYEQVKEDVAGYEGSSIDIMEVAVSYVESGQDYYDYVVDMVDCYITECAFEELEDAYQEHKLT